MKTHIYRVPPTMEMGSYSGVCRSTTLCTFRQDALSSYNSARAHDGLARLRRMPTGTTYTSPENAAPPPVKVRVLWDMGRGLRWRTAWRCGDNPPRATRRLAINFL